LCDIGFIVIIGSHEELDSDLEIIGQERGMKKKKVSYEKRHNFQESWVAKHPWSEQNIGADGYLVSVRCRTCSEAQGHDFLMGPKIDTIRRHQGRRKAIKNLPGGIKKYQVYVDKNCRHLRNEYVLAACSAKAIDVQVTIVKEERARKCQHMGTIFHLLQQRRPILEYEARQQLFVWLKVPTLPKRH
jgi:hypothetical protein